MTNTEESKRRIEELGGSVLDCSDKEELRWSVCLNGVVFDDSKTLLLDSLMLEGICSMTFIGTSITSRAIQGVLVKCAGLKALGMWYRARYSHLAY